MTAASEVVKLQGIQAELLRLKAQRDALIRELDGQVGTRELARFLGLSPAQVSRIRTRPE